MVTLRTSFAMLLVLIGRRRREVLSFALLPVLSCLFSRVFARELLPTLTLVLVRGVCTMFAELS